MTRETAVDDLAQEIRRVDGKHSLGAGALAEALMPFIAGLNDRMTRETAGDRWEPVAEEVTALVARRLEPVVQKVRDGIYDELLTTVQDYLCDNLSFNIASRLAVTERGRRAEWERAEAAEARVRELIAAARSGAVGIGAADEPRPNAGAVADLVEALRFYANDYERPSDGPWGVFSEDFGDVARSALAKYATQQGTGDGVTEAARAAYRACISAWSCGEPEHRVRTMLDAMDRLGEALGEVPVKATQPPVTTETKGEWNGPGTHPHYYFPAPMEMGDCGVCGHTREAHDRVVTPTNGGTND